ncbi:hypothetical protein NWP17_06915 [Chrysosporum bergii ANA360D]|jgi:hypothetical protein|uniref:Uncharacterized protein n=1 Tax=Chrysosporum bergii ANA360D TaxID=617107 RepID=A0AA43GSL9_9CYAN|nr:hypothetical protein [Chrysosporum bergii]MDH6060168.1 hypothetical protein [Chrysosporum bergii ANA360D]
MERGLLWLPLLAAFFWLAWQGSREYQKLEGYRVWAQQFDKSKYDIYAVLGLKDNKITWGKPSPKGLVELETFSVLDVKEIRLLVDNKVVETENYPRQGGVIQVEFLLSESQSVRIPFTEVPLAANWAKYLQGVRRSLNFDQ